MNTDITPSVVSITRPLGYYTWGKDCEAWNLVSNRDFDVKVERMPAGSEEILHFHSRSQQFFYILKGRAVFEIDEVILLLHPGDGLHIEAGRAHRIMNKENEGILEFLVFSQPPTDD